MIKQIEELAKTMRRDALEVAYKAKGKSSHFGSAMSIVDIVATLYKAILRLNPQNPLCRLQNPGRPHSITLSGRLQ